MRKEIIFAGQGGQGIVLTGKIFAKAANLDGKEVAYVPSFGAEARGGECTSEIVVSDEVFDFPGVMNPDIVVAMSQEWYNFWISKISKDSEVFFDIDTVKTIKPAKAVHIPILATKTASDLGLLMAASMVILGVIVAVTEIISLGNLFEVIKKETGRFASTNLDAVREGYKLGKKYLINRKR